MACTPLVLSGAEPPQKQKTGLIGLVLRDAVCFFFPNFCIKSFPPKIDESQMSHSEI